MNDKTNRGAWLATSIDDMRTVTLTILLSVKLKSSSFIASDLIFGDISFEDNGNRIGAQCQSRVSGDLRSIHRETRSALEGGQRTFTLRRQKHEQWIEVKLLRSLCGAKS